VFIYSHKVYTRHESSYSDTRTSLYNLQHAGSKHAVTLNIHSLFKECLAFPPDVLQLILPSMVDIKYWKVLNMQKKWNWITLSWIPDMHPHNTFYNKEKKIKVS
jgi:hypothetical protein